MGLTIDDNVLLGAAVYLGAVVAVFWLAMVIWAYRDMRARSRDMLAQLLVAVTVAILTLPGLFIYIMLRPRETLSEAYERSLEEEALLQEIEEKPTCPGCGQRVQSRWQACPYCHTRLKKLCLSCRNVLDLSWTLCPYCTSTQTSHAPDDVVRSSRHVTPPTPQTDAPGIPDRWINSSASAPATAQGSSLQFIDGDEFER